MLGVGRPKITQVALKGVRRGWVPCREVNQAGKRTMYRFKMKLHLRFMCTVKTCSFLMAPVSLDQTPVSCFTVVLCLILCHTHTHSWRSFCLPLITYAVKFRLSFQLIFWQLFSAIHWFALYFLLSCAHWSNILWLTCYFSKKQCYKIPLMTVLLNLPVYCITLKYIRCVIKTIFIKFTVQSFIYQAHVKWNWCLLLWTQ